jgi:hypothetical protein
MMRLSGKIKRVDRFWAVEIPILNVFTQGYTKKEAYIMVADAVESLVNKEGFKIKIFPGKNSYFEIGSSDAAVLIALLLRRQRTKYGLTLEEVSKK